MRLEGTIEIGASPAAVWALLVDPVSLAGCVPGVQDVRQVDERTFEGRVSASVGPIDGQFAFTSVLQRQTFPADLEVHVDGVDSVTKSRLETLVRASLDEPVPGRTTLRYDATVKVKGRLAILGEMILRATASMMIAEATRCLRARLEGAGTGTVEAPE
ncbi:MAG TPA: SRPBCC domain-containing protein [Vitreimonas sp.]|nr:SRPBCC domain-containing protein [Vitreimonas sp.]